MGTKLAQKEFNVGYPLVDALAWINKRALASNCVSMQYIDRQWVGIFLVEHGFTWEEWERVYGKE